MQAIARRFFSEHDPVVGRRIFYDNLDEIRMLEKRVELHRDRKAYRRANELVADNRWFWNLRKQSKTARTRVSELRKRIEATSNEAKKRRLKKQMQAAILRYNKAVNRARERR